MRSSRSILCVAAVLAGAACASTSSRVCAPVVSWSAPAYACHQPVVEVAPPGAAARASVRAEKIEISEMVQFETDSSVIRDQSKPILNDVARIMKDHPEIELVRVEGHTDNIGTPEHNLALSRDRARSVKNYLVSQGVDANRLATEGYGLTKPIADNATEDGRYKNRRVEFLILKRKGP